MSIKIGTSDVQKVYIWWSQAKEVYVWTTKVRPTWWQPWSNTLIYLPLNWNTNNLWTYWASWNWTLPSSSYYSWWYIQGSSWTKCYISKGAKDQTAALHGNYSSTQFGTADRTISVWIKWINFWTKSDGVSLHYIWTSSGWTSWWWFGLWSQVQNAGSWEIWILRYNSDPYTTWLTFDTNRHNYIITYNNTNKAKMYVDGTQLTMTQYANSSFNTNWTWYWLWCLRNYYANKQVAFSEYIIENKARTATEASDYYNLTKWNYWL